MNSNTTVKMSLFVGLLSVVMPVLAHATPGDAFDDTTYPTYATDATVVPGPIAGPKALAFDDASYPDVLTGDERQTGIAVALSEGPEPYAHDDTSYPAPTSPQSNGPAAVVVARTP